MKRTCETCTESCPSFFGGQLNCFRDMKDAPVDNDHPACEHYKLSKSYFANVFGDSLAKARRKHPDFVPLPGPECASMYATRALIAKTDLESRVATGHGALPAVLFSECYEFMSALAVGDFKHALADAGDVVAVLYRALNGEGKKVRDE